MGNTERYVSAERLRDGLNRMTAFPRSVQASVQIKHGGKERPRRSEFFYGEQQPSCKIQKPLQRDCFRAKKLALSKPVMLWHRTAAIVLDEVVCSRAIWKSAQWAGSRPQVAPTAKTTTKANCC